MRTRTALGDEPRVGEDQRDAQRLLVDVEGFLAQAAVCHCELAVIGEAHDQRVLAKPRGLAVGLVEAVDDRRDLLVDSRDEVGVEVDVLHALLARAEHAQRHVDHLLQHRVGGRLEVGAEVFVEARRQLDIALEPVGGVIARPAARERQDVVWIDQRDDHAERPLGRACRALTEERDGLLDVGCIMVGPAAAKTSSPHIAPGIRRDPAVESVCGQVRRRRVEGTGRSFAQVPLATVLDVVAGSSQHRRQRRDIATELGLGGRHGAVARQRVEHPVLGRHQSGEEGRPAGAAHRRVANRVLEADPVAQEPSPRGQATIGKAARPMHRRPLLVGDDQNEVQPLSRLVGRSHRRRATRGAPSAPRHDGDVEIARRLATSVHRRCADGVLGIPQRETGEVGRRNRDSQPVSGLQVQSVGRSRPCSSTASPRLTQTAGLTGPSNTARHVAIGAYGPPRSRACTVLASHRSRARRLSRANRLRGPARWFAASASR